MCAGAIVQARIPKVVIGCMNPKAGCAGSVLDMLHEDGFNHQVETKVGLLGEECSQMLKDFFKALREEGKRKKLEQVQKEANKEEAEELLSMYNPNVKYIYQGTENDFAALKEKGLEGYVFLMDADTDLGMFVNKDDAKIYYFHPSGYLELAE